MTLRDHIRLLRERWRVIVGCLILGLCAAAVVTYLQPRSYTADVRMYVASQITPDTPESARELALLSEQRVRSYQELVKSDRIGNEVVARLGLPLSGGDVRQRLSGDAALDTVVLTITAVDGSPTGAANIANAAAEAMIRLVEELEQPPDPVRTPPVVLRVVEPALPPQAPVWPNPPLNLAAGAAFGLLVGVGMVGLQRALDDSVRTPRQAQSATRAPVLGSFAYNSRLARQALPPEELRRLPENENVRLVRTRLQLLIKNAGGKVVGITSSMPGEGQTAALHNLAVAVADSGWRVVVVEGDLRSPTVSQYFRMEPEPGMSSVLTGRVPLEKATRQVDHNLFVLSSAPVLDDPSPLLNSKPMAGLLTTLRQRYDIVLVDVPPVLTDAAGVLVASHTDGCVLVVRHGRTTSEQAGAAAAELAAASVRLLGTVLTMVPKRALARGVGIARGEATVAAEPFLARGAPASTGPWPAPPAVPVQRDRTPAATNASRNTTETPQSVLRRRPSPRPRSVGPG